MESFVEDYATETEASTSLNNNSDCGTDTKSASVETKQPEDVNSAGGSDARKRTKPEGSASKAGSEFASVIDDNFDWFDGIVDFDEDMISDGAQDDIIRSASTEPSAKRHRRWKRRMSLYSFVVKSGRLLPLEEKSVNRLRPVFSWRPSDFSTRTTTNTRFFNSQTEHARTSVILAGKTP